MKTSVLLAACVLSPGVLGTSGVAALRRIRCDAPGDTCASLVADVEAGRVKVCTIDRAGAAVGFLVFEATADHELIIHAAFGRDDRCNLVDELIGDGALIDRLARQCECDAIRFHTVRPGLVRRSIACGFRVSEIIMRRNVR